MSEYRHSRYFNDTFSTEGRNEVSCATNSYTVLTPNVYPRCYISQIWNTDFPSFEREGALQNARDTTTPRHLLKDNDEGVGVEGWYGRWKAE